MGNLSRANVYDVLKNKPRDRVVVVSVEKNGQRTQERRIIKRPEGRCVEQFVDLQGNVVWITLLQLGTNHGVEMIDKNRATMHREGFIEYHRCPVRHGTRFKTEKLSGEFAEMPPSLRVECVDDPVIHETRGKHVHANEPCPHIQWLIEERRHRAQEEQALRATQIETAADIEKKKLEVQEQHLAESRELNKRLLEVIEGKKGKKGEGG